MIHELCHVVVIYLYGEEIYQVKIDISGAEIHTDLLSNGVEALCAAAGPMGSALLLLTSRKCPELAFCGFVQLIFNSIPVYPLDGGRVMRCLFVKVFGNAAAISVACWFERIVLLLLLLWSISVSICYRMGITPIFVFLMLIYKYRKISCKRGVQRVQ